MPSPKKPGHTRLLVAVPDDVHEKANARRRRETTTWSRIVTELLRRWGEGDDAALSKPVKVGRPSTPEAAEMERLHEQWMRENPAYAKACTEKVDVTKLKRYRSLAELFAADAAREGRVVPAEALAEFDSEDKEADRG